MIYVAVEDELSERVARRLLKEADSQLQIVQVLRRGGFGYLKTSIHKFIQLSSQVPVFLLTDLDSTVCPIQLLTNWLGSNRCPEKLLFRIAVRETESWLLADHEGMRNLFGRTQMRFPSNPDALPDAKSELLRLARSATRQIQYELLPAKGVIASQGLGYNSTLGRFVDHDWNPSRAAARSESLDRTVRRLRTFVANLR